MGNSQQNVIATRTYSLENPTSSVVIRLFHPILDRPGFYRCHYEIAATGEATRTGYVEGIDEIDVILCALAMLGTNLTGLNESVYGGKLEWEGGIGLGLPTIEDHWPFKKR